MCVCLSSSPPPHSLLFSLGKIDWVILLFPPWCRSLASLGEREALRAVWRHTGIMIMKERAHTWTFATEENWGYLLRESLVKESVLRRTYTCPLNYFLWHTLTCLLLFYGYCRQNRRELFFIIGEFCQQVWNINSFLLGFFFLLLFAWACWRTAVS